MSKEKHPKPIFTVTCIHFEKKDGHNDPNAVSDNRTWGWYSKFEDAEYTVINNETDMFEDGWYKYAVIEKVPFGLLPENETMGWYEVNYVKKKAEVKKIKCPTRFDRCIGFSMG